MNHIVKASLSDAESVFNLVNAAYKVEIGREGLAFKNVDRYRGLKEAENDMVDTYVIRDGDALKGCIRAVVVEQVASIGPIAVDPTLQGKGIGSQLMRFAETLAETVEVDVVSCREDLIAFYGRMGFAEVNRFPALSYDSAGDIDPKVITRNDIDIIIMRKKTNKE